MCKNPIKIETVFVLRDEVILTQDYITFFMHVKNTTGIVYRKSQTKSQTRLTLQLYTLNIFESFQRNMFVVHWVSDIYIKSFSCHKYKDLSFQIRFLQYKIDNTNTCKYLT